MQTTTKTEPSQLLTVEAVEKPHSVSFTKTAKGGWRADGLKVYHDGSNDNGVLDYCLAMMRNMDSTAVAANALPPEDDPFPDEE